MDGLLLALTLLSIAATLVLGALAWNSTRRERERSAARVTALAAAIDHDGEDAGATLGTALFSGKRSMAFEGHSRITAGVGAVMLVGVALGFALTRQGGTAEPPVSLGSAALRTAAPIELMSMRHSRDRDMLTVAGLVRNPQEGVQVRHLTAVVFGFDRRGGLVTSARGALDFVTLQPGDESAFVVTLPHGADVARYRVTFQTDGGVLRHVDRRSDRPVLAASNKVQG
jgi:hypothetical protein